MFTRTLLQNTTHPKKLSPNDTRVVKCYQKAIILVSTKILIKFHFSLSKIIHCGQKKKLSLSQCGKYQ